MANVQLEHAKHKGLSHALDGSDLVLTVPTEVVAGGAGFADAPVAPATTVELDLDDGRAFHHKMVGNITGLSFANVPAHAGASAAWTWVLWIDATGGYTLAGTPTVTWLDGSSWTDLDLTANATNIVQFVQVGTITYATLVYNASIPLDPYKVCFLENATVVLLTEDEDIDAGGVTKNGDGTITLQRDSGSGFSTITTRTTFNAGDRLGVICASATGTTTVRIPRYF